MKGILSWKQNLVASSLALTDMGGAAGQEGNLRVRQMHLELIPVSWRI